MRGGGGKVRCNFVHRHDPFYVNSLSSSRACTNRTTRCIQSKICTPHPSVTCHLFPMHCAVPNRYSPRRLIVKIRATFRHRHPRSPFRLACHVPHRPEPRASHLSRFLQDGLQTLHISYHNSNVALDKNPRILTDDNTCRLSI